MHRSGRLRLTGRTPVSRSAHTALPRLIVMTRYPEPGASKTRLSPALGPEGAARLHAELASHCIRRMHAVALGGCVRLEVRATGGSARQVRGWLGRRVTVRDQGQGDLGKRLANAAGQAFREGASAVILVGSDAPELGGSHIREALDALQHADVVVGPAADGGYYLLGISAACASRAIPAVLESHVPWSSSAVLEVTLTRAAEAGLSTELLGQLADVDRAEDLVVWEQMRAEEERVRRSPRLSVVIPALNEESRIASAVASARRAGAFEVIVADGSSTDDTAVRAQAAGAIVVTSERGRARQMNSGAAPASGDVLLFLHADTTLPDDALAQATAVMGDPDVALGSFRYAAGEPDTGTDPLITNAGRLRHRVFGIPYGDQALFVRARDFADMGGFPDIPVMEDYELARRFSRLGWLGTASASAISSARAWRDHGLVRATWVNAMVITGYRAGVSPQRLARWRSRVSAR